MKIMAHIDVFPFELYIIDDGVFQSFSDPVIHLPLFVLVLFPDLR